MPHAKKRDYQNLAFFVELEVVLLERTANLPTISMLYSFVKIWTRAALLLFCKRICIHNPSQFRDRGPILIAANHPNSFLDAILIGALMKQPVHFLTRSDVFKHKWIRVLLHQLQMIPVYRIRDGKDKLSLNESSFRLSCQALEKGENVLIFAEGFCNYQTTLQPLRKGAARILLQSWEINTNVKMLPVWIHYNSFSRFGKTIHIGAGNWIRDTIVRDIPDSGNRMKQINRALEHELLRLSALEKVETKQSVWAQLLLPFAVLGFLFHVPFYAIGHFFAYWISFKNVHYDSILFCFLSFLYPCWLAGIFWLLQCWIPAGLAMGGVLLMPFFARSYLWLRS